MKNLCKEALAAMTKKVVEKAYKDQQDMKAQIKLLQDFWDYIDRNYLPHKDTYSEIEQIELLEQFLSERR